MVVSRYYLLSVFFTFSAFSGVSFEDKVKRVESLEALASQYGHLSVDAYHRDLEYEKANLTFDKRAENETNLLAEKIRLQVIKAYEAALVNKTSQEAILEVKAAIEKDIELIEPAFKEEIRELSLSTLELAELGQQGSHVSLENMNSTILKGVKERADFLNSQEFQTSEVNSDKTEYSSKEEILKSLASDGNNTGWINRNNVSLKSGAVTSTDSKISLQVKASFLGVEVDAGPSISFSRSYKTFVNIGAEGLTPAVHADGNFDFIKRDQKGNVVKIGGKTQKRTLTFFCEAALDFSTVYSGAGGFSVMGLGARSSVSKDYSNSVILSSRRIIVPEFIAGKTVTYNDLIDLCHKGFLKAKISKNQTVSDSLNVMMKNIVSSLRFSHPKTKCAQDNHCLNWFNNEIISLVKINNTSRCVERGVEKYRTCELRGLKGQNCAVIENGKRVSDGSFEYTCDTGLKCVKTKNGGWFTGGSMYSFAKGECRPVR